MISLKFLGGAGGVIGGNAITLEIKTGATTRRYLFDYGVVPGRFETLRKHGSKLESLEDLVRLGVVTAPDGPPIACFVSHGHHDHTKALPALLNSPLRPGFVWASHQTSLSLGKATISRTRLSYDPFGEGNCLADPELRKAGHNLRIALYPVDHDATGACSVIALTDNLIVLYTGDFTDSGFLSSKLKQQFWQYVPLLRQHRKLVVVTEGTNFGLSFRHTSSENFGDRLEKILSQYKGNVIGVAVGPYDLWDIAAVIEAIRAGGHQREIVLTSELARNLELLASTFSIDYDKVLERDERARLLEAINKTLETVYVNERESFDVLNKIKINPGKYILISTRNKLFGLMNLLQSMAMKSGGCILYFCGEPDEVEPDQIPVAKLFSDSGFSFEMVEVPARGHVSPHGLLNVMAQMKPDEIYTMHSLSPDGLAKFLRANLEGDPKVYAPRNLEEIEIA